MTHQFFSKALRHTLVTPNKIVVQSRPEDEDQYSGEATDAESYALLPKVEYVQTYLTSNAQAQAIAEAKLAQAQMWCEAGAVTVPMTLGQEAFDYVNVVDSREGDERAGNVGQLTRYYSQRGTKYQSGRWETKLVFGNWQSVRKALANLNITSDELQNYFSRLTVKDLYVENITMYMDEITDGPDVYVRQKSLQLNASGVFIAEDTLYTIRVPGGAQHKLTKSTTAPTSPTSGDFWIDTNYIPNPLKMWDGDSWDELTAAEVAEFNRGTIYRELKDVALTADGLVVLDQVQVGTYGLIKSAALSAGGLVLMDEVEDGTYHKVLSTQVTAGGALFINSGSSFASGYDPSGKAKVFRQASAPTGEVAGDLWVDTDDKNKLYRWSGAAWVSIRDTDISQALQDAADAYALADTKRRTFRQTGPPGSGMVAGDIWIDTDAGDRPYTYNGSDWIAAYTQIDGGNITTGTINCQVVTVQTAGSGDRVVLDSSGITVIGQLATFKEGSTTRGYVYGSSLLHTLVVEGSTGLGLISDAGDVLISASGYGISLVGDYFVPTKKASAPTSSEGRMYFNTADKKLYLYTTLSGTTKWWTFQMA